MMNTLVERVLLQRRESESLALAECCTNIFLVGVGVCPLKTKMNPNHTCICTPFVVVLFTLLMHLIYKL